MLYSFTTKFSLIIIVILSFTALLSDLSLAASEDDIDAKVNKAIDEFKLKYEKTNENLLNKAFGVLVFPKVLKAGLFTGVESGKGALRDSTTDADFKGPTVNYYNMFCFSVGLQFGVQTKTVFLFFRTEKALSDFKTNEQFKIGIDSSLALISDGIGGSVDTKQILNAIDIIYTNQTGLMLNLTLEAGKITKITK